MTGKPLHVAFMVGSLRIGGAERMMVHTANEMSHQLRVSFLSLTGGGELKGELKKEIVLYSFDNKKSLSSLPSVLGFLKKEKPDVLISTQIHVNLIAVLLKIIFRLKTKIVLREATSPGSQFLEFNDFKSKLVKLAVRRLYPKADAIIAICEAVKKNLLEHHFAKPSQVSVIYNPVINSFFLEGIRAEAKHEFFYAGVPVVISIGRLTRTKNFALLLNAFALFLKKSDARLIIIGDGPEKENLLRKIKELQLERKTFLPGKILNPYAYLEKSSVYVLTSLFEGLPNALIEAMACGVQLVSVDCPGGSAEILMNGKLGKLTRMNPEVIAEAMQKVLMHPVDKQLLLAGTKRFESAKISNEYLALIQKLCMK